jgi:Ca2+-binding EF-hand superfamily protein
MHATMKSLLAATFCLAGLLADVTSTAAQQSAADWAKRWFMENDRDHDGYLTADEVIAYQLKLLKRMDRFDDGNISPQEYCAGIDPSRSADMARCHKQFAAIDANGNGYITAEEVTNYYQLVLKAADVNKDDKVSLEEWLAAQGGD